MNLEFHPGHTYRFIVQAYLESQRAWVIIAMPSHDLGNLQSSATSFSNHVGVPTRIKKIPEDTLSDPIEVSNIVKRNRRIFEPMGTEAP